MYRSRMIQDLYETHIHVANFERSRHFYEDLLGLSVGWIDLTQRRLLYWVGAPGEAMLSMWRIPGWMFDLRRASL